MPTALWNTRFVHHRDWIGACVLYTFGACVLTWPLVRVLPTHLPLGGEPSATVPLFNLWTLLWNADQLREGYPHYWQAPIFHPTPGAFALSEPQPLTGLLFAGCSALTSNDVAAYNLVLLLALMLNGLAAYTLFRVLTVEAVPALLGGLLAQSLPFISNELGVLQLVMLGPLLASLAAAVAFTQQPGPQPAAALGVGSAATLLTCGYYGLFLSIFLLLGAVVFARRQLLRWQPLGWLLLAGVLAGLAVIPLLSQQQWLGGYTRGRDTITANSAQLGAYLRLDPQLWGWDVAPWLNTTRGAHHLYPGTGLLLLAVLGVAEAWRRAQRRWVVFCTMGAVLALTLSLGLNLQLGEWQPYDLLRSFYPGLQQLRSPFRLGLWVQLLLLGLGGYGIAALWRWRGRCGRLLALVVVALSLLEVARLPARLYPLPQAQLHAPWLTWLGEQPPGPVALVPFPPSGRARDYVPTVLGMLQARVHKQPLVNGYSGFFPTNYLRLRRAMHAFPNAHTLGLLRATNTQYVVVAADWFTPGRASRLAAYVDELRLLYDDDDVRVYRLVAMPK